MPANDSMLAVTILQAFRIAYRQKKPVVAEHLLRSLEHLESEGCACGCRDRAYALMSRDVGDPADEPWSQP